MDDDEPQTYQLHISAGRENTSTFRRVLKGSFPKTIIGTVLDIKVHFGIGKVAEMIRIYWRRDLKDNRLASFFIQEIESYPAQLFTSIDIPVRQFQQELVVDMHRARATGPHRFRDGPPRADWVWIRTGASHAYGSLRGHLPGRLCCLFKLRIPSTGEVQRLAIVAMTRAESGGQLDKHHGLVSVSERDWQAEQGLWVVNIRSLVAMAHLIPQCGKTTWYFVNSRIDLWTFNMFY